MLRLFSRCSKGFTSRSTAEIRGQKDIQICKFSGTTVPPDEVDELYASAAKLYRQEKITLPPQNLDWLPWLSRAGTRKGISFQLLDGQVRAYGAATPYHNRVVTALAFAGGDQMDDHWEIIADQKIIYDQHNRFTHDVAGWPRGKDGQAAPTAIFQSGVETYHKPIFACEVLSPSTEDDDLPAGRKFVALEKHGVPFYWIIDPKNGWLDIYQHNNPFTAEVWQPGGELGKVMHVRSNCHSALAPPFTSEIRFHRLFRHLRGP